MPASLTRACKSAPTKPGVNFPNAVRSTSLSSRVVAVINCSIFVRDGASGTGKPISLENRPRTPGSIASGLRWSAHKSKPMNSLHYG